MHGQAWAGERTWVNRWGGTGISGYHWEWVQAPSPPRCCCMQMQLLRTPMHCSTAKPGATLPSTLPPATALQSNKKAETATCLQPECFCWCFGLSQPAGCVLPDFSQLLTLAVFWPGSRLLHMDSWTWDVPGQRKGRDPWLSANMAWKENTGNGVK